jgi:hypothetical protein
MILTHEWYKILVCLLILAATYINATYQLCFYVAAIQDAEYICA